MVADTTLTLKEEFGGRFTGTSLTRTFADVPGSTDQKPTVE